MYTSINNYNNSVLYQPGLSAIGWLRYLMLMVVTMSFTFAQSQPGTSAPQSVADALAGVTVLTEEIATTTVTTKGPVIELGIPVSSEPDSFRRFRIPPISPSKYISYQGNRLWWTITAKSTPEDITVIKNELDKYGVVLDLTTITFDPREQFIDHLDYRLARKTSNGVTSQEGNGQLGTPIWATGGYLEWVNPTDTTKFNNYSFVSFRSTAKILPNNVRKVVAETENWILTRPPYQNFDSLMTAAERKYGHLGIGFRKFDKKEVIKQSGPNSSVRVDENGYLSVDNVIDRVKVYINNEPVSHENIRTIKVDKLYKLAVVLGYDNAKQQRTGMEYLFFYTEK